MKVKGSNHLGLKLMINLDVLRKIIGKQVSRLKMQNHTLIKC